MKGSLEDAKVGLYAGIGQLKDAMSFLCENDRQSTLISSERALRYLTEALQILNEIPEERKDIQDIKEAIILLFDYSPVFLGVSTWEGVKKQVDTIKEHYARKR